MLLKEALIVGDPILAIDEANQWTVLAVKGSWVTVSFGLWMRKPREGTK